VFAAAMAAVLWIFNLPAEDLDAEPALDFELTR
jgi:hypothetical protein